MKKWGLPFLVAVMLGLLLRAWVKNIAPGLPLPVYIYDLGRLAALLGFVLLTLQYVLSTRWRIIERGIGLDRLLAVHRILGVVVIALFLAHPILFFLSETLQGYSTPLSPAKVIGIIALLGLLFAGLTALLSNKIRWKYETWKAFHMAAFFVFPVGFVHAFLIGSDLKQSMVRLLWVILAVVYSVIVLVRIGLRIRIRRHPYRLAEIKKESHDTWTLVLEGTPIKHQPGQFMFLQLVQNDRISEPHPFTISSSPGSSSLSVTVKSVGDFTRTLPGMRTPGRAFVDAPFGTFSYQNHDAEDLVFIAGGIGITPFLSMLRDMRDRRLHKRVTLFWGNKRDEDIICRKELDEMVSKNPGLEIIHVLSRQEDWQGEKGHINTDMLGRYKPRLPGAKCFICGPPTFLKDIRKALQALGVPRKQIYWERFALR